MMTQPIWTFKDLTSETAPAGMISPSIACPTRTPVARAEFVMRAPKSCCDASGDTCPLA